MTASPMSAMIADHQWAIVALAAALLVLAVVAGLMYRGRQGGHPIVARPILTDYEIVFYRKLLDAVPASSGMAVHPQVAMSAFLQPKAGLDAATRSATFNRFSQKRPDFVLVDRTMRVRLIVELDDSTHNADKDRARDRLAGSAGIRTLRFTGARRLTVAAIRAELDAALRS